MTDAFNGILIAAIDDWISVIVPIVFFVIYALNQLLSIKGNVNNKRPPQRGMQERPLGQRPAPPPAKQRQLSEEIEQFLKRANDRRERPAKRQPASQGAKPVQKPAKTRMQPPRRLVVEQAVEADVLDERDLNRVAESVQKRFAQQKFGAAEHMADDIALADEQMAEHLKQVFDHKLGSLGTSPSEAPPQQTAPAKAAVLENLQPAQIAALLRDPRNARQVIVMAEILQRPEHRW